ncbi:SPARC-related modular calcium-binding protein 2 isoform X2 [Macrosteles quadrilineatus]|uniref:SPARC-related modular calcium-binding protein 2 isoform X2 n=1 Tax=Macrosteles quadrilineatus TaxID=74068 RepID=UPI0023E2C26F|nr:SPARC-related modular calcium-binding protein 2 isoform X2 [Macrosteles quadrilineatus]
MSVKMCGLTTLLGVCVLLQLATSVHSKVDCASRIAACSERARRPVCGTDNKTYPTRCHLLKQHCRDDSPNMVAVKHRGQCKEKQPCWSDQGLGQGTAAGLRGNVTEGFTPRCLADGRYAPVQCHARTGYCWCVTAQGEPIPNTSVRHAKPRCNRKGKMRRGSFPRENKHKKDCSRIDRSTFVSNLVKIFRNEYNRQPHMVVNKSEDVSETDRRVLEWKFNSLDVNGDLILSRNEYWGLRELVRQVVKPKRCARAFSRNCDLNRDTNIAKPEWMTCLGLDMNPGEEEEELDVSVDSHFGVLQESVVSLTGQLPYGEDAVDRKEETEVSSDCLTDRQAVLDEMKTNNNEMYIPECTTDGRYQKVQCYKSTGYCWCVNEDSGTTIPGTSVKDNHPKCDSVQPVSRPMKGCPEHRKQAFLKGLLEFLTHTMATQKSSNITIKDVLDMSQEEQIASWNFNALDTNKNKVLEKNEWKAFRSMISSHRKLRRCGKKLPRYCDVNHDRKISLTEWLNCLNAQRPVADSSVIPTPNPRRKGPNPLESYLKGDD